MKRQEGQSIAQLHPSAVFKDNSSSHPVLVLVKTGLIFYREWGEHCQHITFCRQSDFQFSEKKVAKYLCSRGWNWIWELIFKRLYHFSVAKSVKKSMFPHTSQELKPLVYVISGWIHWKNCLNSSVTFPAHFSRLKWRLQVITAASFHCHLQKIEIKNLNSSIKAVKKIKKSEIQPW